MDGYVRCKDVNDGVLIVEGDLPAGVLVPVAVDESEGVAANAGEPRDTIGLGRFVMGRYPTVSAHPPRTPPAWNMVRHFPRHVCGLLHTPPARV